MSKPLFTNLQHAAIAALISACKSNTGSPERRADHDDIIRMVAHIFAEHLQKDNPRFNSDLFFRICTVPNAAEFEAEFTKGVYH